MPRTRTRRTQKPKAPARVVVVVDTPDDNALELVVGAVEETLETLDGQLELDLTFAANLPPEDEAEEPELDEDDDLDEGEDEEEETEVDAAYTEQELEELSLAQLRDVAKEFGVEVKKGKKSATYIRDILAAQEAESEEDEEEPDDEDGEYLSLKDLKEMRLQELKKLAREYGIKVKSDASKSDIIDAIVEVAGEE